MQLFSVLLSLIELYKFGQREKYIIKLFTKKMSARN